MVEEKMYDNVHVRKLNYWLVCLLWCDNMQSLSQNNVVQWFQSCMPKNLTM
jgi:hypothetical protein